MSESNEACIYVIEHPDGFYKIGRSHDPEERLDSFQTGSPYELRVLTTISAVNDWEYRTAESLLHSYYDRCSVRGEWFELPEEEVEALCRIDRFRASDLHSAQYRVRGRFATVVETTDETLLDLLRDVWALEQRSVKSETDE